MPAPPSQLPRVIDGATFVPFHVASGRPHVVVDGPARDRTVLALSHWPAAGTPPELDADTSTEIVARYLDRSHSGPAVEAITNNHYDEDGLLAAWMLLERVGPGATRDLAIAAAEAGDFSVWRTPEAAWVALTLMAVAERETTPYPEVLRALNRRDHADPAGDIYVALIPRVADVLDDPGRFRRLWNRRWERVLRDRALIESGDASVEELPGRDLAVVTSEHPLDRLAVYPLLEDAMRVVFATSDGSVWLEHRYETWVRYVSRRLPARRDLTGAASALNANTPDGTVWRFEGVDAPQARLLLTDSAGRPAPCALDPRRVVDAVLENGGETRGGAPKLS